MWMLELNIAGYRVAREVPGLARPAWRSVWFGPRRVQRRASECHLPR
jgi:hypothetical protein